MAIECTCIKTLPLPGNIQGTLDLGRFYDSSETELSNTVLFLLIHLSSNSVIEIQTTSDGIGTGVFSISEKDAQRLKAEALKTKGCPIIAVVYYEFAEGQRTQALYRSEDGKLWPCFALTLIPSLCTEETAFKLQTLTNVECTGLIGCACSACQGGVIVEN